MRLLALSLATSLVNLYKECGWVSLTDRRQFQKLCFMYKCTNSLVPDYISDLIPPFVREVSNYPLRNRNNVSSIYSRTEIFSRSCIPSGVTLWNSLDTSLKQLDSFASFRRSLKSKCFSPSKVPDYFVKGNRKWSIIHARIRNNCSDLQFDLFQNHLSLNSSCSCGNNIENALHFFFECENYRIARIHLFRETREFHPLSLEYILYGKPSLSNNSNFLLFQAVHRYIKESKRFS